MFYRFHHLTQHETLHWKFNIGAQTMKKFTQKVKKKNYYFHRKRLIVVSEKAKKRGEIILVTPVKATSGQKLVLSKILP